MGSSSRGSEADQYLAQYPDLHRWLNVCVGCGARGYKPTLPKNIYPHFNVATDHLRKYFQPLEVNQLGYCTVCAKAIDAVQGANQLGQR